MRLLGLPIVTPDVVAGRVASDLGALARAARRAPEQLDRLLELGGEFVAIGHRVLELGERIDRRAELILALGDRIDARAEALLGLGGRIETSADELLELGGSIRALGEQMDARGADIVDRATRVSETGTELVAVLPTLQRAIEMTTPLEGAIDRVGRLVDRLPGGAARRRVGDPADMTMREARTPPASAPTAPPHPPTDRPAPPDGPALDRS
jgi:hypothetical protein